MRRFENRESGSRRGFSGSLEKKLEKARRDNRKRDGREERGREERR